MKKKNSVRKLGREYSSYHGRIHNTDIETELLEGRVKPYTGTAGDSSVLRFHEKDLLSGLPSRKK